MSNNQKITPSHFQRHAYVYVLVKHLHQIIPDTERQKKTLSHSQVV